ncbi:MAG: hypothetical protein BGO49_28945 [Planctomycetales bacterium 71-10]|nr:MAG: hypothetical protein BGO49_28945 [Planctomycetales bacterium 71-10]
MSEEPKTPPRPDRIGLQDWLRLARAVPSAFDVRKLVLAAAALVLVQAGWSAVESISPPSRMGPTPRALEFHSLYGFPFRSTADFAEAIRRPAWNLTAPIRVLVGPLMEAFAIDGRRDRAPTAFLRLLWAIAVLGAAGSAIARLAVVEAATGRRPTLREALGLGIGRAGSVIAAPLHPLAIALALGVGSAAFGLVARMVPQLPPAMAALLTVGPLLLGLASATLLVLMVATWPLVPVAVAAESDRAVEAIGRTFGYVRRRPMGFAACVLVSWGLGTLGLAAFEVFLSASVHQAVWGAGLAAYPDAPGSLGGLFEGPGSTLVGLACPAWTYAFFWSAAARAYLLLRQDVDDVPASDAAALR